MFSTPVSSRHARLGGIILRSRSGVILEFDASEQEWSAVCPELRGCASFGRDEAEAQLGIKEAVHLYLTPDELDLPVDAKLTEVTVG